MSNHCKISLPKWVDGVRPAIFALTAALTALALSLVMFAPHIWLWQHPVPGSFEWDRGLAFAEQVANPTSPLIAPALRWRCLPVVMAHYAGLHGYSVFLIGWLGVIALLAGIATWMAELTGNRMAAFAATLLVAESSAVIVPTGWFGINDAWAWLGLAAVSCSRRRLVFVAALLLSPWVDERFLLALPLALWARRFIVAKEPLPRELALVCACVGPYLLLRIWVSFNGADATSGVFVRQCLTDFGHWAPSAPFGWWMAWRLAWLLPGWAAWSSWQAGSVRSIIIASGTAGAGMAMATFLAADLSRSAAMLLPGMLASFVLIVRRDPVLLSGWALALAGANLLVPAAHVVSMKIALISALPVELWRWAHL